MREYLKDEQLEVIEYSFLFLIRRDVQVFLTWNITPVDKSLVR